MKPTATSKPFFSPEEVAAARAAAREQPAFDPDSPPTQPQDWDQAIVTHGGGVEATLAELREQRRRRGAQKAPTKVPTTIRFDADVLEALKATGKGWQTRVNEAMREWVKRH